MCRFHVFSLSREVAFLNLFPCYLTQLPNSLQANMFSAHPLTPAEICSAAQYQALQFELVGRRGKDKNP